MEEWRLYLNQLNLSKKWLPFHRLIQDEIYRATKKRKFHVRFYLSSDVCHLTFLTVLSRSNAMSGIFASNINENRFANTLACL